MFKFSAGLPVVSSVSSKYQLLELGRLAMCFAALSMSEHDHRNEASLEMFVSIVLE